MLDAVGAQAQQEDVSPVLAASIDIAHRRETAIGELDDGIGNTETRAGYDQLALDRERSGLCRRC